ncbi:recombinase family protein [Mesorhizobium sp. A623]
MLPTATEAYIIVRSGSPFLAIAFLLLLGSFLIEKFPQSGILVRPAAFAECLPVKVLAHKAVNPLPACDRQRDGLIAYAYEQDNLVIGYEDASLIYGYACLSPFEKTDAHAAQMEALSDTNEIVSEREPLKARIRPALLSLVGNVKDVDNWWLKYPAPERVVGRLQEGDVLVVTDLARLGYNAGAFGKVIEEVLHVGASVHVLEDNLKIKSTRETAYRILRASAAAEWKVQGDSTRGGHLEGRKRGHVFGRPPILTKRQENEVFKLIDGGMSQTDVKKHMRTKYPELDQDERGFSQPTISRMLKRRREKK